MLKIRKGDTVSVLTGRDKGKTGVVEKVFSRTNEVLVGGVNLFKKHKKKQGEKPGSVIQVVKPLKTFRVALVCPKCKKPSRVKFSMQGDQKSRVCSRCGEAISVD